MGPPDLERQEGEKAGHIAKNDTKNGVTEESKHAQSRIRVITLEAARLRKELRDSEAKRQRAVDKCKEYEEKNRWGERAISELRYSNKQLQGELKLASEAAAASASRNRAALASLRAGLGAVEQAVAERAAKSHTQLQGLFSALQSLQTLVLQRANVPAGDLLETQRLFAELVHGLGTLSSLIGGGLHSLVPPPSASEPPTPAAPPATVKEQSAHVALMAELLVLKQRMTSVEAERARLSAEATSLREELARERNGEGANAAALIPQYRMAVVKARAQASALRERLAEGSTERATLREEAERLQKALRERSTAQEAEAQREALKSARALSEATAARQQLEADVQVLRKRLGRLEGDAASLVAEKETLLVRCGELEQQCKQHRQTIRDLRALIADQRADAQFALEMVSKRPRNLHPPEIAGHSAPRYTTTHSRPATASVVYETLERGSLGLGGRVDNEKGRGRNGLRDESGVGLDTSPSSEPAEKGRERHRYHRSRRRRDRVAGQDGGYASVPNPGYEHGVRRAENRRRVDVYRTEEDGLNGRLGGDNLSSEGDRHGPAGPAPSGLGRGFAGGVNGAKDDGRGNGGSLTARAERLGKGPASEKVADAHALQDERNSVNGRPGEEPESTGRPNGGVYNGSLLNDLLLTETESEGYLLGVGKTDRVQQIERQFGSPTLAQSLPAGQWPSHGLAETAAAFEQPASKKSMGDKETWLGRQEADEGIGSWKGAAAAAGSEELQKGMAALDKEIADLQTSLQAASWRLQV